MFLDRTWVVGPFQCNCRLLACPKTGYALLVDPGDEPGRIVAELGKLRTPTGLPVQVKYLLHTHGHLDHIGASRPVAESLAAEGAANRPKIALHRGDEELYRALRMQGQLFGLSHYADPLPVDHYLEHEEALRIGELRLSVVHTPGHSPGSVCFRLHEDSTLGVPETLFSGDTLFQGSVGRTDLWGGDQEQMFRSIRDRILVLDDETRVCPGHGPETRIGIEKRENPFL
ncbi:MAG: MBL fold metallo-hydrolase [Oligoflexia bacterium]|nr:MBL fold metallo-hydrolase [Oligoflexia bacterium]